MLLASYGSFRRGDPESGYNPSIMEGWAHNPGDGDRRPACAILSDATASIARLPPVAVWQGTAETLALPDDLSGWIVYCDPPYQGTSGYPHGDCPRETVLRLAREWSERGAVVAISEAVPLPLEGWHRVEIGHARKGQKRTFSRQQEEWLTMNRPPAHVPAKQVGLFGGDK